MVEKFDAKLDEWRRLVESKGYSDEQLRYYLSKQGYSEEYVNDVLKEIRKNRKPKKRFDLKKIFKL